MLYLRYMQHYNGCFLLHFQLFLCYIAVNYPVIFVEFWRYFRVICQILTNGKATVIYPLFCWR